MVTPQNLRTNQLISSSSQLFCNQIPTKSLKIQNLTLPLAESRIALRQCVAGVEVHQTNGMGGDQRLDGSKVPPDVWISQNGNVSTSFQY
jgi:hypothetical protein